MSSDLVQTKMKSKSPKSSPSKAQMKALGEEPHPGKMFVGGLSWQTTLETLQEYFKQFGAIKDIVIMKDPGTTRSRGFGFVTFSDPSTVDVVLTQETHELDGKKIDPKLAFPRKTHPAMVTRSKKLFVGGLSASTTMELVRSYFEKFGPIEDVLLMVDKQTNRHRGFGFVIFQNEDVADKVCKQHFHEINNKLVECKLAQPKEVMLPSNMAKMRNMCLSHGGRYAPYGLPPSPDAYTAYDRGCCDLAGLGFGFQQIGYQNYAPNMQQIQAPTTPTYDYRAALLHGPNHGVDHINTSPPAIRSILKRPQQLDIPNTQQLVPLPFNGNQSYIRGSFTAEVISPVGAPNNNGFYTAGSPVYELFGDNPIGQVQSASSPHQPRPDSPAPWVPSTDAARVNNYDNYEMTQLCSFLKAL